MDSKITIKLSAISYQDGKRGNCFMKEMDLIDKDEIDAFDEKRIFINVFEGIELNNKELLSDAIKGLKDRIDKIKE